MASRRPPPRPAAVPGSASPADGPKTAAAEFGVDDLTEFDDLPDAVVQTEEDFLASVGVAAPPPKRPTRKPRRPAPRPRPPASASAAAELLNRQREEAGYVVDDPSTPLPPRRRSKARATSAAEAPAPAAASLNKIVLLTALAVPALGFAVYRVAVGHQSDDREWRQAYDELDDLMHGFVAVSGGSEAAWSAWAREFERTRPDLEYLVERAPRGSAGDDIDRAVTTMENAVRMRTGGETGPALKFLVNEAADHTDAAAVKLGFDRRMERPG